MKKILLAGVIGGIVLFVWGWLVWAVLPLHEGDFKTLGNEEAVVDVLRSSAAEHAVYAVPGKPQETTGMSTEQRKAMMDEWAKKHQRGPVALIVYSPTGTDPMMTAQMILGLLIMMITAAMAAWFLSRSTAAASGYIVRVIFCGMLGVFASFVVHLMYWNWFYFPLNYTTAMVADTIIGWLLAGLVIGAIVKTPRSEATR